MSNPLRLGVAGLGVVGTSLVRLLQRRHEELIKRVGRDFSRWRLIARAAKATGESISATPPTSPIQRSLPPPPRLTFSSN